MEVQADAPPLVGSALGRVEAGELLQPTEHSLGAVLPLFVTETVL